MSSSPHKSESDSESEEENMADAPQPRMKDLMKPALDGGAQSIVRPTINSPFEIKSSTLQFLQNN